MSYGFDDRPETVARESARLRALAECRDPRTHDLVSRCGIERGWHCLEIGAGTGSVSEWLGERVGPEGRVLSTDIDLRFHRECQAPVEVRRHDAVHDPFEAATFDLVHARGVLQHIAERELVLDRMIEALKPGGWIIVEDSDFDAFARQPLPEPLATLHSVLATGAASRHDHDRSFGVRCLALLRARGLVECSAQGDVWTMRGNDASGEWWFLAMEHTAERLTAGGVMTQADIDVALAQARSPEFAMLSPLAMATIARTPHEKAPNM